MMQREAETREFRLSVLAYIGIGILMAAVSAVLLVLLVRSIVRPIRDVARWSEDLAEGDLTRRLDEGNGSEFGVQARNLNKAADSISGVIGKIQMTAREADLVRENLTTSAERTRVSVADIATNLESSNTQLGNLGGLVVSASTAAEEISANVKSLNTQIGNQSAAVIESTSAVEEMMSSIRTVASTSETRGEAAQELKDVVASGREKVVSVAETVDRLAKSIDELQNITNIIESINVKSNLLSMNAAIEAAHAGANGTGFSVVAQEMRNLSEITSKNAKDIKSTLQTNVIDLESLALTTQEAADTFGKIEDEVVQVADSLSEITGAMEEMNLGSHEILQAIENLRQISAEVQKGADEMGDGSSVVTEAVSDVMNVSEQVRGAISEIGIGANEIQTGMDALNERVSSVVDKIGEIKKNIEHFRT